MTSLCLTTVCVTVLTLLCGAPAQAQDKKDPIRLFNEASGLAEKGQLEDAVAIWLLVQEDIPDKYKPVVQVNLGLAYKKMKHYAKAWHHLTVYLKAQPKEKDAAKWLKQVEKKLRKTHSQVTVNCAPADARIFVQSTDTKQSYACPLTWWFEKGTRPIRVERDGYKPAIELLKLEKAGQTIARTVTLQSDKKYGHLVIEGDGRAVQVFINGILEGKVPFRRKLKAGPYDVMVGPPGKIPWKKRITIVTGKTITAKPDVAFKPKVVIKKDPVKKDPGMVSKSRGGKDIDGPKWWYWGLIGGGVTLLAAGGATTVLAIGRNSDLADKYDQPGATDAEILAYEEDFDSEVKPLANVSYVFYGLGGAAVATGVVFAVLYYANVPDDTPAPIAITPMPGGMAITTTWEF
jgi:hypothetical protein